MIFNTTTWQLKEIAWEFTWFTYFYLQIKSDFLHSWYVRWEWKSRTNPYDKKNAKLEGRNTKLKKIWQAFESASFHSCCHILKVGAVSWKAALFHCSFFKSEQLRYYKQKICLGLVDLWSLLVCAEIHPRKETLVSADLNILDPSPLINLSVYKAAKEIMSVFYTCQEMLVSYTTEQSMHVSTDTLRTWLALIQTWKSPGNHTPADTPHTETLHEISSSIYVTIPSTKIRETLISEIIQGCLLWWNKGNRLIDCTEVATRAQNDQLCQQ